MLNKFIQRKRIVLLIFTAVLLILWTLTLIFGNGEDKVMVLVLSLVLPFVMYGFVRLMYKVIELNASPNVMLFFFCFFLIGGSLSVLMDVIRYIAYFPNGLSPVLGAEAGAVIATLDHAKKNMKPES